MAHQELYLSWLKDAYALERSLEQVLEHRVKDLKDQPQMRARVQQHLEETRRHAELVKSCIERHGESVSMIKSGLAKISGMLQGTSTGMAKDEMIKNGLTDYAAEHFEIASYTSLVAAAEELGDTETAQVCRTILRDEESMAEWLAQQIPVATRQVLQMQAREHGA
ncbi:ferritin-like domain-containing protein [Kallotenue papyrolyticum]|uniref:ferritin-like domain-containing protein n=1 Tax=Kallotenue papyrolyticum TaxID=1325125 RepID=UPI0004929963|nr:ferritin-like domain-containing protein [Kallotenue papyrolyticum]